MAGFRLADVELPPDVFAFVMATGIVAVAAGDHQYAWIAAGLAGLASLAFVILTLGVALGILTRRAGFVARSRNPDVALRMFTFVAAAAVLGVVWLSHPEVVLGLSLLGLAAWLVLVPLAARDVASRPRADLRDHAHGAWLLASVATSGLATTAADLAIEQRVPALVVAGVLLWLGAIALYAAVTWLIAWRTLSAPFRPEAVTPDSWILMGALAIAALAGAHLVKADRALGALAAMPGWLDPATVGLWAVASLWIPVLLYAEMWRVDQRAGSLHFAGVWWSAVFPLGMYASATAATGAQMHLRQLATVSLVFFWVAFAVWTMVAVGMVHAALLRRSSRAG